jgi:microcystin-dependent protein
MVGINNASPATTLDVKGTVTATGLSIKGPASVSTLAVTNSVSASSLNVSGAAALGSASVGSAGLSVMGPAALGSTTVNGNAVVTGTATLNGGATISGTATATTFSGNGIIPVGGIIMWSGAVTAVPAGWALCNGKNGTPNLMDRFVVGAGNSYAVNATGGTAQVTLAVNNIPPHSHSYVDNYFNLIECDWRGGGSWSGGNGTGGQAAQTLNTQSNNNPNGAAQPFDVRPPYYALAFIMRVQ